MSEELVPYKVQSLADTITIGELLAKSGYFADSREAAQAVVKVLYGQEVGIGPVSAMTGVHIIQGKPAPSAGLMAALIKRSGKYDYRIIEHTDTACEIAFFEHGEEVGRSRFTIDDAKQAGALSGKNAHTWKKYPRNMLFARTLSNGAKWYCPDVFGGPVYVADEFSDAPPIDITPKKPPKKRPAKQPKPTPEPEKAWPDRPFDAAHTIRGLRMKRDELAADHPADTVPEDRHGALMGALAAVTAGDTERHALGEAVWGKPSTKDWTAAEAEAIVGWVNITQDEDGNWMPNAYAVEEARAVTAAAKEEG